MTSKSGKSRGGGRPLTGALARWETEGGALGSGGRDGDRRELLSEEEAHILQCLGAAVLLQWNDLPTEVQREIFGHTVTGVEPSKIPILKEKIARFLHNHKDDKRKRK